MSQSIISLVIIVLLVVVLASSIKIIHPETDVILRRFQIHSVSFAAQDSNTETVFSQAGFKPNSHIICDNDDIFICQQLKAFEEDHPLFFSIRKS